MKEISPPIIVTHPDMFIHIRRSSGAAVPRQPPSESFHRELLIRRCYPVVKSREAFMRKNVTLAITPFLRAYRQRSALTRPFGR